MDTKQYWQAYVGEDTPQDFLRKMGARDPEAAVAVHMQRLPSVFGLAQRDSSWVKTFSAPEQPSRSMVNGLLVSYLEETRETWEPEVQDLPLTPRWREATVKEEAVQVPFEDNSTTGQEVGYSAPLELEEGAGI